MTLDDNETEKLKEWVIQKLQSISDADSDILADFVVALAKSEEPEATAKASSVENLQDFLADKTEPFVDELFQTIKNKSFDTAPKPTAAPYQPPRRTSAEQLGQLNGSRKRSYHDVDRDDQSYPNGRIQSFDGGERPMKHPRRGGRGHDLRGGRQTRQQFHMPQMPMPPDIPPLDPNNPMASFMAMQQQLGLMPPMPPPNFNAQRCRDYDQKGFCAAGASCPYEHGNDPVVIPGFNQPYDPNQAALMNIAPSRTGHMDMSQNEWGRGRGGTRGRGRGANNIRGGGQRSIHSQLGPSRDRSNTTIVVESIPEDKCDEQSVREFFEQFGNVNEVTMKIDKKLALVKFENHDTAQAAYESPKVVFDNRFVKVFWYRNDAQLDRTPRRPTQGQSGALQDVEMQDEDQIDPVELAKKQEEAQRRHEEAKKQREEMEKKRLDVDAQLKAKEAERQKMAALLAKKTGKPQLPQVEGLKENGTGETQQTKDLKAQLAKLEAEARGLGLNPDEMTNGAHTYTPNRGRGGFRGRPRGRGYSRGAYGGGRGGAVMRLDNRPKTIAVTFEDGSYSTHEEALRQFLLFNNMDSATLSKHPDRDDTALIAFNQRFEGENFMTQAASSELTHIGKVDMSWYKAKDKTTPANGEPEMPDAPVQPETTEQPQQDYNMAEDEDLDQWS